MGTVPSSSLNAHVMHLERRNGLRIRINTRMYGAVWTDL